MKDTIKKIALAAFMICSVINNFSFAMRTLPTGSENEVTKTINRICSQVSQYLQEQQGHQQGQSRNCSSAENALLNKIWNAFSIDTLNEISAEIENILQQEQYSHKVTEKQEGEPEVTTRWQKFRQSFALNPRNWRCWRRLSKRPARQEMSLKVYPAWIEDLQEQEMLNDILSAAPLVEPCNPEEHTMQARTEGSYQTGYVRPPNEKALFSQSAMPFDVFFARFTKSEHAQKTLHKDIEQEWIADFLSNQKGLEHYTYQSWHSLQNLITWKRNWFQVACNYYFETMKTNNLAVNNMLQEDASYQAIADHARRAQKKELEDAKMYQRKHQYSLWHSNPKTCFAASFVSGALVMAIPNYFALKKLMNNFA